MRWSLQRGSIATKRFRGALDDAYLRMALESLATALWQCLPLENELATVCLPIDVVIHEDDPGPEGTVAARWGSGGGIG